MSTDHHLALCPEWVVSVGRLGNPGANMGECEVSAGMTDGGAAQSVF